MSGSSGGPSGGGSITNDDIVCEILKFEAQVASPNPVIVATLTVGDVLYVTVAAGAGIQEIKAHTSNGELVGGLLTHRVQRLRECILEQHNYKATVLSINSGQVRVLVEHI